MGARIHDASGIELSGGPIHYREAGEGEPLVFVHGFGANWRLWRRRRGPSRPTTAASFPTGRWAPTPSRCRRAPT